MRCHEIQERFVELLYDEPGTPSPQPELREHVRACTACRKRLEELKSLQATLRVWEDEPPLRPVSIPQARTARAPFRISFWSALRYAAVAALITLAFLSLSNAQIRWDRSGFSFSTSLRAQAPLPSDFYTKEEMRTILGRVMNESQKVNFQMIQRMLDTIDQERAAEYRSLTQQIKGTRIKN